MLKSFLPKLDAHKLNENEDLDTSTVLEMKQLYQVCCVVRFDVVKVSSRAHSYRIQTYSIRGFPLFFPFTDLNFIIDAAFNTDVHSNQDSNVEFALAVYCSGNVKNLARVWIFLASLNKPNP